MAKDLGWPVAVNVASPVKIFPSLSLPSKQCWEGLSVSQREPCVTLYRASLQNLI